MKKRDTMIAYKKSHPNCIWCVFCAYKSHLCGVSYRECELKDSIIQHPKMKAKFCKWYHFDEKALICKD